MGNRWSSFLFFLPWKISEWIYTQSLLPWFSSLIPFFWFPHFWQPSRYIQKKTKWKRNSFSFLPFSSVRVFSSCFACLVFCRLVNKTTTWFQFGRNYYFFFGIKHLLFGFSFIDCECSSFRNCWEESTNFYFLIRVGLRTWPVHFISSRRSAKSNRHLGQFDVHPCRMETARRKGTVRNHSRISNPRPGSRCQGSSSIISF